MQCVYALGRMTGNRITITGIALIERK